MPEMATNFHGGSQSPNSLSKPLERVFEDAQHTGEINLSGRKLREYPKLAAKYDLVDTISADISKNRLPEVPKEICTYISMEKLNCYHNVIKVIPDALVQLQALTYLNLSRNQLTVIPVFVSQLQALEVLIASHNRLVSLPEEIGILDRLMELDVSCNEISHLPLQIGDLKSLKSLNVRRNLLQELPVEISKLNLRKLDISSNRISKIPTVFRRIETLEDIVLDNNPLTTPPAHVCTKGKQHIMKYLHIIAIREDKTRLGMLNEVDLKRYRKSLPPTQSVSSEEFRNLVESPDKWKRHTVLSSDSGYSTTDSVDKCGWSPQEGNIEPQHLIESNNLAVRAAAAVCRDQRMYPPPREPRHEPPELPQPIPPEPPRREPPPPPQRFTSRLSTESENLDASQTPQTLTPVSSRSTLSAPPTPPTLYPSNPSTPVTPPTPQGPGPGRGAGDASSILGTSLADEFTRELQRQRQEYENRKKIAEQLRIQQEEEEREQRRLAAQRVLEEQQAVMQREAEEAKRREDEQRLAEETRKAAELEAKKQEEARQAEEMRRKEELRRQEEARQNKTDNNFYLKLNSSYNYNQSSHAWPPPPSPLASQNEAWSSPVANENKAWNSVANQNMAYSPVSSVANENKAWNSVANQNMAYSPVSPEQHVGHRTTFSNSSYSQHGHGTQVTSPTSPGHYGPGQNYRTTGRQSPAYSSYVSSSQGHGMNQKAQTVSGHSTYQRQSPQNIGGYRVGVNQQGHNEYDHLGHRSELGHDRSVGHHSPGGNTRQWTGAHNQSPDGSVHSPQNVHSPNYLERHNHDPLRQSPEVHYGRSVSYQPGNNDHYSQRSQQNVSVSRSYSVQSEPVEYCYNAHSATLTGENSSQNTSVSHSSCREFSTFRPPMSPLHEQTEPSQHGYYGNMEHDRYGNQHVSPNSMSSENSTEFRKPNLGTSDSFKEERRGGHSILPYRRTVSDSNQRLPASSHPAHTQLANGPIDEHSMNGTAPTPTNQSVDGSPNTSFNSAPSTPPHGVQAPPHAAPLTNGPSEERPKTPQGSVGMKKTKTVGRDHVSTARLGKPGDRSARPAGPSSTRSALPTSKKTNLNQDEEIRRSNPNLKESSKPGGQRVRSIQKDAVNNLINRRSSGSTSSEDDRKRSTPTRSLAMQHSSSSAISKRSGTVMTSAHVKMLDDYSKEAAGANFTLQRHKDQHAESRQLMEQLRKTISTRLKRSLPENLSEALSDGVLLCHLANQIRPRSVASVHVPSPAVPKLTPPKCRKNVENFLEACRKIGVAKDQICEASDILTEKGTSRVASTVAALVSIATHSKNAVAANV